MHRRDAYQAIPLNLIVQSADDTRKKIRSFIDSFIFLIDNDDVNGVRSSDTVLDTAVGVRFQLIHGSLWGQNWNST